MLDIGKPQLAEVEQAAQTSQQQKEAAELDARISNLRGADQSISSSAKQLQTTPSMPQGTTPGSARRNDDVDSKSDDPNPGGSTFLTQGGLPEPPKSDEMTSRSS